MNYLDPKHIADWYATAKKGDAYVYHRGFIAVDRDREMARRPELCGEVAYAADFAKRLAESNVACLIQRRVGPSKFDYIIVKKASR